jgi:DNA-binding response OmpR family regulator
MSNSKRVLIIDSQPEMADWLTQVVNSAGYDAITTGSATVGLVIASEEAPSAILCNVDMPGLNGFHVLRLLKDHVNTANTPVILITGEANVVAPQATAVLQAPFEADELLVLLALNISATEPAPAAEDAAGTA